MSALGDRSTLIGSSAAAMTHMLIGIFPTRVAPPSLHPVYALASRALSFPSAFEKYAEVGVRVHVDRRTPGERSEIKGLRYTVLVGGIVWLLRRDGSREDRRHLLSDIKYLREWGRVGLCTYSDTTKL